MRNITKIFGKKIDGLMGLTIIVGFNGILGTGLAEDLEMIKDK